jgi:lipopolysaccharide transport system ATP-binding protein
MSDAAIRAEGLGKQYVIGGRRGRNRTLRETLTDVIVSPFRRSVSRSPVTRGAERGEKIWALRDASFEVRRGEVLGVIGSNGAGKSTLLKILSRIVEPTTGYVEIHGRVGSLLEVGTGFHLELTGRENIHLNGAILGMKRTEVERKFDEIVSFSEVGKFLDTPVKHYSSGMHMRLAFSVAAHLEPEILLVDEVLAVGDFAFQKKCLGKMQDVAGGGRTVIFVSHNTGAVRTLCDRCLLLGQGEILADGPSDSVVGQYINQVNKATEEQRSGRIEADHGEGFVLHHKGNSGVISMFCGDPVTLEFDIEAPRPLTETETRIGITIVTQTGDPLMSMSSLVQQVPSEPGTSQLWRIRCDMGRLPINTGTYYASMDVGHDDRGSRTATFTKALTIIVLEHDVFGWGRGLPSPRWWGPLYWAPQWDIRPVK